MDYNSLNARNVLREVEKKIEIMENTDSTYLKKYMFPINAVYRELSIFDTWVDYLSLSKLKDMRRFLKEAIKLGFEGYVCFKVGARGCANGMWAHKEPTTNGYSPNCDFIYKSFTPEYNYWSLSINDEFFPSREEYDSITKIKDLENLFKKLVDNN